MKTTLLLSCLILGLQSLAQLETVADLKNKVICNYFQTQPFKESIRTNIHAGNASLSCIRVKDIPSETKSIQDSPIKINMKSKYGLICYTINTPAYQDDRRGHLHGGHSAVSCLKISK